MSRYRARRNPHPVPRLSVSLEEFEVQKSKSRIARVPASVWDMGEDIPRRIRLSNRRLYFLALREQYRSFAAYCPDAYQEIAICPHFHTALVTSRRSEQPYLARKLVGFPPAGPLLSFAGSGSRLKNAVASRIRTIHSELEELCHYNSSDNYYVYENLLTHIERDAGKFSASPKNLKILVKTNLVANRVLLRALRRHSRSEGRMPASAAEDNPYLRHIVNKSGIDWLENYLHSVE